MFNWTKSTKDIVQAFFNCSGKTCHASHQNLPNNCATVWLLPKYEQTGTTRCSLSMQSLYYKENTLILILSELWYLPVYNPHMTARCWCCQEKSAFWDCFCITAICLVSLGWGRDGYGGTIQNEEKWLTYWWNVLLCNKGLWCNLKDRQPGTKKEDELDHNTDLKPMKRKAGRMQD